MPKSRLGQFLLFFLGEIVSSLLIVLDYRAIAIISFMWTGIINLVFFTMNFCFLKTLSKPDEANTSFWSGLGYVIGGIIGAEIGLWLTVHLYGR